MSAWMRGSSRSAQRQWIAITDSVRPGLVALPGRWWHEGRGAGAVVNLLTPSRYGGVRQTPAYNECFVEVAAAR